MFDLKVGGQLLLTLNLFVFETEPLNLVDQGDQRLCSSYIVILRIDAETSFCLFLKKQNFSDDHFAGGIFNLCF